MTKYTGFIEKQIHETVLTLQDISNNEELVSKIEKIGVLCAEAIQKGQKIIFAGNGGSAADSQHLAAEFVSKLSYNRPAMPAIAITTDTSALTAIGNDYGFEKLFSRQIEAIGNKGDIFIAISTSGNSKNIVEAINAAKKQNLYTVGLTGNSNSKMSDICDLIFCSPSKITPKIQETHIMIGHTICAIAEDVIFGKEYGENK
ncbi:MAG: D-sedoheptulose 7-phosphate isomerase [Rickettsiales bacterium]